MKKIHLCNVTDVPNGFPLKVEVSGHEPFAVYKVGEEFFVSEDTCPHMGASLSEDGEIEDHYVECTLHSCKFNLRTGEAEDGPCSDALEVFEASIEEGGLFILASNE